MAVPSKTLTVPPPTGAASHLRPSPAHLPSMALIAADLDDSWPIRIVNPLALDACDDCRLGSDVGIPEGEAVATVIAHDGHAFGYRSDCCALHLSAVIRHYKRHGWPMVVEVPTCSRQWFVRTDRETFHALDDTRGIGVTRAAPTGGWAVWEVSDNGARVAPLRTFPADHGDASARLAAECWAQDHAARIATAEFEAASAPTVALPIVTETKKAA